MEVDILILPLSSARGTYFTAFQPAPEQTRRECLAEKAGAVAGPNAEHTGMVGSPGLREWGSAWPASVTLGLPLQTMAEPLNLHPALLSAEPRHGFGILLKISSLGHDFPFTSTCTQDRTHLISILSTHLYNLKTSVPSCNEGRSDDF